MYFLHAPKLVLTGSSPSLRATGDRAAALGAEVVVVDPRSVSEVATAPHVAELDGFDVAVVGIAPSCSASDDLLAAAELLGPGLRQGALVIVSSTSSVETAGRRLARDLAERSGLEPGTQFDVVWVEGAVVRWSTGDEGVQVARFLVTQLGVGAPVLLG
jgi:UDP-N-acetyl-D-mannosaminuronate dehydrogenase